MVTVINYKTTKNKAGEQFNVLELQGDVELIQSVSTGKFYAHTRKATMTSTLNEATCKALIGTKFPGTIRKIECEQYAYKVPETNEIIMLNHNYQYVAKENAHVEEAVFSEGIS